MTRPGRKPLRITGQRPDECPACEGVGYTPATCTETRTRGPNGKLYTHRQGSGCPDCLGMGKRVIAAVIDEHGKFGVHPELSARIRLGPPPSVNYRPGNMESTR